MLNNTLITLPITAWFNDAFPDQNNEFGVIPNNSVIDKNKTGFGITYAELMAKRNSWILLPYVPIIESKIQEDFPDSTLFDVQKGVTVEMIEEFLTRKCNKFKKILVTPESFLKVIIAGDKLGNSWLYSNFFCYIDEMHAYAIDAFRGDAFLNPLRYAFKFSEYGNLSFGSATPYPFSDPKFKSLAHKAVRFHQKFGKISIVPHEDPKTVLHHYLTQPDIFPGSVFIFYNSVRAIGEAVLAAGLTDVNIYCRDEEKNMDNLGAASQYFKTEVNYKEFKKFNFFTCRYYEGFDLKSDTSATVILVTDTSVPHSLVGIKFRGVQAVGRLRLEPGERPDKIIHITNILKEPCMKDPNKVLKQMEYAAQDHIEAFNRYNKKRIDDGMPDSFDLTSFTEQFSDIINGIAVINHWKIDQRVYAETFRRDFNSLQSITRCWEDCNYDTEIINFSLKKIEYCRKSHEVINREIIELFESYKDSPELFHFNAQQELKKLKEANSDLFLAYNVLGASEIKELNYNKHKMTAKMIEKSNENREARLRILVTERFETKVYSKKEVKTILQGIYDQLGLKKTDGSRKIAFADDLDRFGLFKIDLVKERISTGTRTEKIKIVKRLYSFHTAA